MKKERKKVRNRQRKAPLAPITREVFADIMNKNRYKRTFSELRLKVSLLILFVTGLLIGELLTLKIDDIKSLWGTKGFLAAARSKTKRG